VDQATVDLVGFVVAGVIAIFLGLPSALEGYSRLLARHSGNVQPTPLEQAEKLAATPGSDPRLVELRHDAERIQHRMGVTAVWFLFGLGLAIGGLVAAFGYAQGVVSASLFLGVYVAAMIALLRRNGKRLVAKAKLLGVLPKTDVVKK
jgi:hypothetical protein